VRATTDMKVLVMSSHQMQWILEHDYGVDGEMTSTISDRKKQLDRTKHMAVKSRSSAGACTRPLSRSS